MRRALFIFLLISCLALLVGDAAAAGTPGSISLEFKAGAGVAKVRFRGNFLGHVKQGRVIATRNVILSGCEYRRILADGRKLCRGTDLGFRTPSNFSWRLTLGGKGINAGGFVRGCMTLDGADVGNPGYFRKGEAAMFRQWPRVAQTFRLGWGC